MQAASSPPTSILSYRHTTTHSFQTVISAVPAWGCGRCHCSDTSSAAIPSRSMLGSLAHVLSEAILTLIFQHQPEDRFPWHYGALAQRDKRLLSNDLGRGCGYRGIGSPGAMGLKKKKTNLIPMKYNTRLQVKHSEFAAPKQPRGVPPILGVQGLPFSLSSLTCVGSCA